MVDISDGFAVIQRDPDRLENQAERNLGVQQREVESTAPGEE